MDFYQPAPVGGDEQRGYHPLVPGTSGGGRSGTGFRLDGWTSGSTERAPEAAPLGGPGSVTLGSGFSGAGTSADDRGLELGDPGDPGELSELGDLRQLADRLTASGLTGSADEVPFGW